MTLLRRFIRERLTTLPPLTLIATGLALIGFSLIWPRFPLLHGSMRGSGVDFIQGFLIGIGLACELMGIGVMWGERSRGH